MRQPRSIVFALLAAAGCHSDPIQAILTVEDPDMVASDADTVEIGLAPDELEPRPLSGRALPVTLLLTREQAYSGKVYARALAAERLRAMGETDLVLEQDRPGAVTIRLSKACGGDDECDDGVFCNGPEKCTDGVCAVGVPPCSILGSACASASCLEIAQGCEVTVSHESCPEGEYCDPVGGCVPGRGCYQDEECEDSYVCNGHERCISGLCGPGIAPSVADDPCTVDACLEPGGVVNVPDPDADGRYCGDGLLCLAGACIASACNDGILDPRSEECEDGNEDPSDECSACRLVRWPASVLVGSGAAVAEPLSFAVTPLDFGQDPEGNVYVSDRERHQVLRIDAQSNAITIVAGSGNQGYSGDNGPASLADLDTPGPVQADGLGHVFIADTKNHRIRALNTITGVITTHAGTGVAGGGGNGFSPLLAQLDTPSGMVLNEVGSPCFSDTAQHVVRCTYLTQGTINRLAGNTGMSGYTGDGMDAKSATLNAPSGLAYNGKFYIADTGNHRIRVTATNGRISTLAGNGNGTSSGDGGQALQAGMTPTGLALDGNNRLLFADRPNNRVRRIDLATGIITTIAGNGMFGSDGDGGPALSARLALPGAVMVRANGEILIAELASHRIRAIDSAGNIRTLMGNGRGGAADDHRPASTAKLTDPYGLAIDAAGHLYLSDRGSNRVRKVDRQTGLIDTVAGAPAIPGSPDPTYGEGKLAVEAQLEGPQGIDVDANSNLYLSDSFHVSIRRVDAATGLISKVAPLGTPAGPVTFPDGLAIAPDGGIHFSDRTLLVYRVQPLTWVMSYWAGAVPGVMGENILATSAALSSPAAVDFDAAGNGYIGCSHQVRRVTRASGLIATVAGDGTSGDAPDGSLAIAAPLGTVGGVAIGPLGNLVIADRDYSKLREVDAATQQIRTIAGTGVRGYSGDGLPALSAQLDFGAAIGLALDAANNVYFVDAGLPGVRKLTRATGIISTLVGQVDGIAAGTIGGARFTDPQAILRLPGASDRWLVADGIGQRVVLVDRASGTLAPIVGYPGGAGGEGVEARYSRLLDEPAGLAYDQANQILYLSERSGHVIRRVDMSAVPYRISTIAGQRGMGGFADGSRLAARFFQPAGLWYEPSEAALYVADSGNHLLRRILISTGVVSTVAGLPRIRGFAGDGGDPRLAVLDHPESLLHAPDGSWYLADRGNNRVRRILGGQIDTVLGDGTPASSGLGSPARAFPVDSPRGLALDSYGNLYVSSRTSLRMIIAGADHLADGGDKVLTIYGSPTASAPPESLTRCLSGLALGEPTAAHVQLLDACQGFLLEIERR